MPTMRVTERVEEKAEEIADKYGISKKEAVSRMAKEGGYDV